VLNFLLPRRGAAVLRRRHVRSPRRGRQRLHVLAGDGACSREGLPRISITAAASAAPAHIDFKTYWGFEPEPLYYEYYLVKRKEMPNLSPTNPRFSKAIELWRKLPLKFTQLVGPPVAKYLGKDAVRIIDFCDVDSDKWLQYSARHRFPMNRVYAREARELASIEARYVHQFDASIVISDAEAIILRAVAGGDFEKIHVVPNGVDCVYFDPTRQFPSPFEPGTRPIVFTGAMDYHANVDGVKWYAREVFPAVRQQMPGAVFAIVGSNPIPEVQALASEPGVIVTGRVPDVRPYLSHASVVVAPLRIARGVQNKVLEALAMARPVVATENALQGIPEAGDAGVAIANDPKSLAEASVSATERLDEPRGRAFVTTRFGWAHHLATVPYLMAAAPRDLAGPLKEAKLPAS
jgi:sugar transferase (PEP-CTERM/EpsH1 system associated)